MEFWKRRLYQLPNFERLEDAVVDACRAIIANFSDSAENQDVYAFAINFDPYYSQVSVAWNSERSLCEFFQKCEEANLNIDGSAALGFRGIRYSWADFGHVVHLDQQESDAALLLRDKFDSYFRRLDRLDNGDALISEFFDAFTSCMFRCIKRLEADFSNFNRTTNFIAFLTKYEGQEAQEIELMQLTVSGELMRQLFPAIHEYKDFCQRLSATPFRDQVEYWLFAEIDYLREAETDRIANLKTWRGQEPKVRAKLIELGENATAAIVGQIDEFARHPQTGDRDGQSSSTVVFMLMIVLEEIGRCDQSALPVLEKLLHHLFATEYGTMSLRILARILHQLAPQKYPYPLSAAQAPDKVLNWSDFGLFPS